MAETVEDLGTCSRCDKPAFASVKGSDEPLCGDHIMEARAGGEFEFVLTAPRKPRFDIKKLREAIVNCDHNIKTAHEWIAQEEARKVEYWGYIEELGEDGA